MNDAITDPLALVPGWYCIGFLGEEDAIDWGGSAIYHYLGDGQWIDESGEGIASFFDPFLQLPVATNAADAYLPQ